MYLQFEEPLYLWLMFSIPLIIISHFYFLKRSKSKAMKFANVETIKRIYGEKLVTKNIFHLLLRVLILFCLIVAITGTSLWYIGESSNVSYIIALDSSASMTAEDIKPNRFDAAKTNIDKFIMQSTPGTDMGLVTFSGVTEILETPTNSKLDLKIAIEKAEISQTGGTDISGAIISSSNLLLSQNNGKAIILISDGVNTLGSYISDPIKAAVEYANRNQVIIYTVAVGSNSGPIGYLPEYYNISATYNEDTLEYIANSTGGKYFYASNADEFSQVFSFLDENTSQQYIEIKLSFAAMILAISFLFIEWGIANTLYRRIL
jgi:Ca-activated chloride channel homolog